MEELIPGCEDVVILIALTPPAFALLYQLFELSSSLVLILRNPRIFRVVHRALQYLETAS